MLNRFLGTFILFIVCLPAFSQRQADLRTLTKIPDNAIGTITDIDSLTEIVAKEFLRIANNRKGKTHKQIGEFFSGYKENYENSESNIYPDTLKPENISIQFLDYNSYSSITGAQADSVYNRNTLTSLVMVPAFDFVHNSVSVNTLCFKVTIEIEEESLMESEKDGKKKIRVTEFKKIDF